MFVETTIDTYLPNLSEYITFEKGESKNVISLECKELLSSFGNRIQKIDVYYNPYTTVLKGTDETMKLYDIRTQKEV